MDDNAYPKYPAYPAYPSYDDDGQGFKLDPDQIREIWHRRRWIGLLAFGAVLACAFSAALSLPNLYRASTKVLVDHQEVSESFVRQTVTAELETRIQTIYQQVTSRERLSDLITRLGLYPDERRHQPLEAVIERMRGDVNLHLEGLEANGRNATVAFTVSYNGRDPRQTATVANTLAGFFVDENALGRKRQAARTAEFLNQQVEQIKAELDQQDTRTGDYIRRHTNDLPQQLGANESALARLSGRLQLIGDLQLRQIERRERLQKEIAEATTGAAAADLKLAEADLSKLKSELAAMRNHFSDRYPEVTRLSAEVASREAQLAARAAASKAAPPPPRPAQTAAALADVDTQLQSLRSEETTLRKAIGSYESRVASTPSRAMELERLARGYDTARERYQSLLKAYEDAKVAASLEQGQGAEEFRVLDKAIAPRDPIAPNRGWLLLIGIVGALAAAVVSIVVVEKLDTSFHAPDDVRLFTKAPILATIPRVFTTAATRRRRFRRVLATGAAIIVLALLAAGSWYVAAGNEMITRLTTRGA
jgi:polysaccharide chain length determinant protein (PEP-CTERM system associated)